MSRKTGLVKTGLVVEGNNGGSFVSIDPTDSEGVIRLRVGHDCVIRIDTEISVFALAAILGRARDIGFRKMIEDEYADQGGIPEWCGPVGEAVRKDFV